MSLSSPALVGGFFTTRAIWENFYQGQFNWNPSLSIEKNTKFQVFPHPPQRIKIAASQGLTTGAATAHWSWAWQGAAVCRGTGLVGSMRGQGRDLPTRTRWPRPASMLGSLQKRGSIWSRLHCDMSVHHKVHQLAGSPLKRDQVHLWFLTSLRDRDSLQQLRRCPYHFCVCSSLHTEHTFAHNFIWGRESCQSPAWTIC